MYFVVAGYDFSNTQIPEQDTTVGNLLQISVAQSPTYAKAWNRFGDWCYSWGRAVLDRPSSALTPEDKEIIDGFTPVDIANKEIVYKILTHNKPKHDEEDIEVSVRKPMSYFELLYLRNNARRVWVDG